MAEIDLNEADEGIVGVLREGRNTPSNIARDLDYTREYVSQRLKRLTEHGVVEKVDRGLYELADEPSESQPEPRQQPTPSRDESPAPEQERSDGALTGEHESVLNDVVESWDDKPERLQQRREAARSVLEYAVQSGQYVGKTEATERFLPEYQVSGQKSETWWRKNIRPVLSELGEYSRGHGGYRIEV